MKRLLALLLLAAPVGAAEGPTGSKLVNASDVCVDGVAVNTEFPVNSTFCDQTGLRFSTAAPTRLPDKVVVSSTPVPSVRFQKGKFDLDLTFLTELEKALDYYRAQKDLINVRILVVGHTDSDPIRGNLRKTIPDNWALSRYRAQKVATAIADKLGIPMDWVVAEGRADSEPLVPNTDETQKSVNRRVDVQIIYERREAGAAVKPKDLGPCAGGAGPRSVNGYRISVDGKPVETGGISEAEQERCMDVTMAQTDIQLKADGLRLNKVLNVTAWPDRPAEREAVTFTGHWNYSSFVKKAEVRLFHQGLSTRGKPSLILPLDKPRRAGWSAMPGEWTYTLRVYDARGRWDDTEPKKLTVLEEPIGARDQALREGLAGYGKNHLGRSGIPVKGGAVVVSGRRVEPGSSVRVMGQDIPLDPAGDFVMEEILPPGRHEVSVVIRPAAGQPLVFQRPLYIAQQDWFYVGLVDITGGGSDTKGPADIVTQDTHHYNEKVWVDGRVAFYLKGKIKGSTLLTAQADTQEQPLKDLFTNFAEKNPRYLLRRLDPDRYYPVYGDDSTLVEDAPTQGKFYVRLERGESHILWGSFQSTLAGGDLAQWDRALYGAEGRYRSISRTAFGDSRTALDGVAASPDTVQERDEFRATGGSLYYLRHQDVTVGSERLRVEIRDKDTGLVLDARELTPNQDYELDYLQGRVVLRDPLPSVSDDSHIARGGLISGHPVYLISRYEYVPLATDLNDMAVAGRASQWLGDHVGVGVTAGRQRQETSGDQDMIGADLTLRKTPGTYIKGEIAQTDGPSSGENRSIDGGFGFNAIDALPLDAQANAYRAETAWALSDLGLKTGGSGRAYWQLRQAGYSAPGQRTAADDRQWGAQLNQPLGARTNVAAKYDQVREGVDSLAQTLSADLNHQFTERWSLGLGSRSEWRTGVAPSTPSFAREMGSRTDLAGQIKYDGAKNWSLYAFGQGTVDRDEATRDDNSRGGLGGRWAVTEKWSLTAEGSGGAAGEGGKVGSDLRVSDRTDLYMNYLVESSRDGESRFHRNGTLVSGGKTRYTDHTTIYGEERWNHGDGPAGITHAYGVDYAPTDRWMFGLAGEHGKLSNPDAEDMERTGGSFSAGYRDDVMRYTAVLQARREKTSADVRNSYLTRHDFAAQLTPSWRALAKAAYGFSDSDSGDFYQADFTEGILGAAYRPVKNDRWNTLMKYTYFNDLASPGQLTGGGTVPDFRQESHVVSLDTTYDMFRPLSVGVKYAHRLSVLETTRDDTGDRFQSRAHLGVLRFDYHVVRHWDAVVEGRLLKVMEAEDTRAGTLVGLYRHLGPVVKLGAGYNFTDFSDDLTDLSYRSHGWFVNMLAKF